MQVRIGIVKKKKKKKSHTINYYGKSGDSRTPGPRQGLYTRNCNWRNYSFYHSWRPSWMPLFAENSRASGGSAPWAPGRGLCPCTPPGALRRPMDPIRMRRIACFRHTHTLDCSQSFIIAFSRVSGRYVKHFSDAKVHQILARFSSARSISFFSSFLCSSQYNKTRPYHECYEHSHGHIVPTNSDLSTMYILRFEKNCYVFNADIYLKIGSLASLARNLVYIFSSFQRVVIQQGHYHEHKWIY